MLGLIMLLLLAFSEIVFAAITCKHTPEKQVWRKHRLILRAAQLGAGLLAILLPLGQKWRLVPALGLLVLLLVIAGVSWLICRKKAASCVTRGGRIAACVLAVLLFAGALVPAFLFTGYEGLPVTGDAQVKETSVILVDPSREDPYDGSPREVPVHFYYPEDESLQANACPLVVFSHGAFGYYQSNVSTYMELASNGYVVAALDHPHHAFLTENTAGKPVVVDMDFLQTALSLNTETEAADPEQTLALYSAWMELRTGDVGFVLDTLEAAKASQALGGAWYTDGNEDLLLSLLERTNVTRIGLMGHSMGGATAVALGRTRPDVTAVVDIDGTMLGEYLGVGADGEYLLNEAPYPLPVLEFVNWETYNGLAEYLAEGHSYPNDLLMKQAPQGFSTTLRDTKHMDFTDLPLLSPALSRLLGSGDRDKGEVMTLVNSLVLDFFNCYLKGEGTFSVQEIN